MCWHEVCAGLRELEKERHFYRTGPEGTVKSQFCFFFFSNFNFVFLEQLNIW